MDEANKETEKLIQQMENRIKKEYAQAEREVADKLNDYIMRFSLKDKKWQEWVKNGKRTQQEYIRWRMGQITIGKRWEQMRNSLAADYTNANKIARSIVTGYLPEVYAINHNWSTYRIERDASIDTLYTLYSRETFERLMRDDPDLLPPPGKKLAEQIQQALDEGKDIRWNRQQIQSVMAQSLLQGESIPKIARRLATAVGDSNRKAATRNARTMATGAQNAGRLDAYTRAENMGIKLKKCWIATLDRRTRHAHRQLDGVAIPLNESFENEFGTIDYPGDPSANPANVYNCRCTTISQLEGHEIDVQGFNLRNDPDVGGMTYQQWKNSRKSMSRSILSQEETSESIRRRTIREYREG